MMMMTMRVPRPIVTLRFMVDPFWMVRFRNKEKWFVVPTPAWTPSLTSAEDGPKGSHLEGHGS